MTKPRKKSPKRSRKKTRQTRRSISVKGTTYYRLKDWADARDKSVSGSLEETIKEKLDAEGQPLVPADDPRIHAVKPKKEPPIEAALRFF